MLVLTVAYANAQVLRYMVIEKDDGSKVRVPVSRIQQVTFDSVPGLPANLYLVGGNGQWNSEKVQRFEHVEDTPYYYYEFDGNNGLYDIWFAFGDDAALDSIAVNNWNYLYGSTTDGGDLQGSFDRRYNLAMDNSFHVDGKALRYRFTVNMADMTYEITSQGFDRFIYFIGSTDGWATSEQRLESPLGDGVYTGFLYCADPNGWGNEFKFQGEPGNWDTQLNTGSFAGNITGDFAGGDGLGDESNIKAIAGEGVYYVTLNLNIPSLNAVKVNNMNLVGDFNGWNVADDSQQMTWDAANYCFVKTDATVTAVGWKFAANNSWDINLGGETPDLLEQNGANLTVAADTLDGTTTVRLYPTRRSSDNIFCTVGDSPTR